MLAKIEGALTARRRRFLYRAGWVTTGALTLHQVISTEEAAFYLSAVTLLLGMADRNTVQTTGRPYHSSNIPPQEEI